MQKYLTAAALGFALLSPVGAMAGPKDCPPGLAKKSPACVPPGQAKKFHKGDRLTGNYIRIDAPEHYGLDPEMTYYRVGDQVYRVDRETREVLDVIGALAALTD